MKNNLFEQVKKLDEENKKLKKEIENFNYYYGLLDQENKKLKSSWVYKIKKLFRRLSE